MRILTALTYYRPHISGLTIYTERLAKALAQRGHEVTVLTSQFDPSTPREEVKDNVLVVRAPVVMRVSKGVIMPTIGLLASRLVLENEIVHLHLPQFDAAGIALRGRVLAKPTVLTYHCDLKLPPGLFNRTANYAVNMMNHLAALSAHRIVTYTDDYARHSPYARRYYSKVHTILPPVELPSISKQAVDCFAQEYNLNGRSPVIGMAARFAAEKGIEVLLSALPQVMEAYPNAVVLYAGQYQDVLGEEEYAARLFPVIEKYQEKGQWRFLGVLDPSRMAAFYPNLDVLVVPSLNSTESFGLVQIEAMMNGVPVIASNLPGVRQPVAITGMGRTFPVGDPGALAEALSSVLADPHEIKSDPKLISQQFSPDATAAAYEALYEQIKGEIG
jgi:glycosyltransferase involved in cell wall biosynthesis